MGDSFGLVLKEGLSKEVFQLVQFEQQNKVVIDYNPTYKTNIHESIQIQIHD